MIHMIDLTQESGRVEFAHQAYQIFLTDMKTSPDEAVEQLIAHVQTAIRDALEKGATDNLLEKRGNAQGGAQMRYIPLSALKESPAGEVIHPVSTCSDGEKAQGSSE